HGTRLALYGPARRLDWRLANQRALANRGLQRGGGLSVTAAMSASRSLPLKFVARCRSIHKYGQRPWPPTPPASCLRTGNLPQRPPTTSPPRDRIERFKRIVPPRAQRSANPVTNGHPYRSGGVSMGCFAGFLAGAGRAGLTPPVSRQLPCPW